MYFLIYSSYKVSEFNPDELTELLVQSREKNKTLNITGMLLLCGWQFVQMLEGEEQAVKALYYEICKDARHKLVILLKEGFMESRIFPDWQMGFNTISSQAISGIEGYSQLNSPLALKLFKKMAES